MITGTRGKIVQEIKLSYKCHY